MIPYYYLQPAWNFSRSGVFTFDGEHPTYGFQPLWMVVLAVLARVSPDKLFFLRASVALGGLFFCLTGVALYRLARGWLSGWRAAIAPVLWTANYSLIAVYITGKENALLRLPLRARMRLHSARAIFDPAERLDRGDVLGLMVLSRVNAVIPARFCSGFFGGGARDRAPSAPTGRRPPRWGCSSSLPFGACTHRSPSARFPKQRDRQIIRLRRGAGGVHRAARPVDSRGLDRNALVPGLGTGADVPSGSIDASGRGVGISYLFGLLPDLAYGAWAGIFSFLGGLSFRLKVLLLAAVGIGSGVWVLIKLRGLRPEPEKPQRSGSAAVIGVILISAAANSLGNWLLLPGYLLWGVWYTVAETLALTLALSCLVGEGLEYWPGR